MGEVSPYAAVCLGSVWLTLLLLQFIDKLLEPGAGNFSGKGSASQSVKENEEETLFMESSLTGSLLLYYILFLSTLKETAPIARMTHSSDVASDVGLPVSYYVNLLSQRGASARFQIRPQMWRQRRGTAGGGKPIIHGQTWVLCVCSSLAVWVDLKEHWEVCSL